jgi:hypothetical protein
MMGERVMHFGRLIGVGLIGLFLMSYSAFAEEKLNRDGIWAGIDVGFGHIERSFGETEEDDNNLFLGFTIGYTLNPHFLIGVELSGWGLNFGGGYDVLLNSNWSITPFLSYSFGDADNQEHEALTVGIGFTWQ